MANDEARAAAREWLSHMKVMSFTTQREDSLANLLTRYAAKAVLAEAEWWAEQITGQTIEYRIAIELAAHLAALKEQAK